MRSALIAVVTALVVSTGTYAVADQGTDDAVRPVPAAATQAPAAKSVATGARRDVSGPCDEAEHANEPRCAGGGQRAEDDAAGSGDAAPGTGAPAAGQDISGPCDEVEHANDPRCTGVGGRVEDRGRDDARRTNDSRVDNSGPGNAGDDDGRHDNSGHGSGGDDDSGDDDSGHGGSGHGGDDD